MIFNAERRIRLTFFFIVDIAGFSVAGALFVQALRWAEANPHPPFMILVLQLFALAMSFSAIGVFVFLMLGRLFAYDSTDWPTYFKERKI